MFSQTLRVRQILDALTPSEKKTLKGLLPEMDTNPPALETQSYPSMLLSQLPKGDAYSALGFIAEELVGTPSATITVDALVTRSKRFGLSAEGEAKVRKSKTTQPFLDALISTRKAIEKVLKKETPLVYEVEVRHESVSGHPDMYNKTQVFEVKLTGMLKDNWLSFLFQVFAYGALMPDVTELYLVLPLQRCLWKAELRHWRTRTAYRDLLNNKAKTLLTSQPKDEMALLSKMMASLGLQLRVVGDLGDDVNLPASLTTAVCPSECSGGVCDMHPIGSHIGKKKTLKETVATIVDASRPYQIFLSGPTNSKMKFDLADCAAAKAIIQARKLKIFVHAQYLINLSSTGEKSKPKKAGEETKEDEENNKKWHTDLLKKNLQIANAMGALGVVVHVGKSTKQKVDDAIALQTAAIEECLTAATKECPLLLETPAGQGTEVLTKMKDFLDYVAAFKDERLRACIDTCHVFAAGSNPLEYVQTAIKDYPTMLKLIHYNDSNGICGSCVDRHAYVGTGHIGLETMKKIAALADSHKIPMVIE
jgi:deoxyribonuclease-4